MTSAREPSGESTLHSGWPSAQAGLGTPGNCRGVHKEIRSPVCGFQASGCLPNSIRLRCRTADWGNCKGSFRCANVKCQSLSARAANFSSGFKPRRINSSLVLSTSRNGGFVARVVNRLSGNTTKATSPAGTEDTLISPPVRFPVSSSPPRVIQRSSLPSLDQHKSTTRSLPAGNSRTTFPLANFQTSTRRSAGACAVKSFHSECRAPAGAPCSASLRRCRKRSRRWRRRRAIPSDERRLLQPNLGSHGRQN